MNDKTRRRLLRFATFAVWVNLVAICDALWHFNWGGALICTYLIIFLFWLIGKLVTAKRTGIQRHM